MARDIQFDEYHITGRRPDVVTFTETEVDPIVAPPPASVVPPPEVLASAPGESAVNGFTGTRGSGSSPGPYEGLLNPPGLSEGLLVHPPLREDNQQPQRRQPPSRLMGPPLPVPEYSPEVPGSYNRVLRQPVPPQSDPLEALADEVARLVRLGQPGYHALLWHLDNANLDNVSVARLLTLLEARGALQPFLRLAQREELWAYLRDRGVDWQFVFDNYRLGPADVTDFSAGLVAGVGVNVGEVLMLPFDIVEGLYVLTGSVFDGELAERRDEFFAAIRRLLTSPVATATLVGQQWWEEFNGHCGQLRLFQAGAMVGKILPDLLAAVKGAAKGAVKVGQVTAAAARRLASAAPVLTKEIAASLLRAEEIEDLVAALRRGEKDWTSASGMKMEQSAAGEQLLRNPDGEVVARFDKATHEELDAWEKSFEEGANAPDPVGPLVSKVTLDLPALARHVVAEIPQDSLSPMEWGKKLHARAAEILRADPALDGWVVAADVPFKQVFPLGEELAGMTVEEFYAKFADELPEGLPRDQKTLTTIIGEKRPDLAAYNPKTGQAIVTDLTTQRNSSHFRKTYLDMQILRIAVEKGYARGIRIMEGGDYFYK